MNTKKPKRYSPAVIEARAALKTKGWTQRAAAPELGVHYSHLCLVLTGVRHSRSLLARIHALPARPEPHTFRTPKRRS